MTTSHHLSRRGLLAAGGVALIGVASGCTSAASPPANPTAASPLPPSATTASDAATQATGQDLVYPFYGAHQSGVETPPTTLQTFIGLDLIDPSPRTADAVLRLVSDDAARLTQGQPALGDTEPGIAASPAGLTITVGIGRQLFERTRRADAIPDSLVEIPAFPTDAFEKPWVQTDMIVQIASDDAVTLTHATRMVTKDLSTLVSVRWMQDGFLPNEPAVPGGVGRRNLMGQVDGTVNPEPGTPDFNTVVWDDSEGPAWVTGGTVLVLRRIRLLLDDWEKLDPTTQENVIGRHQDSGAPLGGTSELEAFDYEAVDANGLPVIPEDAHIRVARAASTEQMILRRPYSYNAGMRNGTNDMGLLFAAYMRDPATSYIPMQTRVAELDAFNRWNITIGSAAYFLPAGAREGGYIGEGIFT
ncbi:MAG: Dyp-type peroxidase [Actinomycetales bacterium]|nr:Dyp-type peroxidase [Actinomycetales bacterium]